VVVKHPHYQLFRLSIHAVFTLITNNSWSRRGPPELNMTCVWGENRHP
jgi:hypothetical protein